MTQICKFKDKPATINNGGYIKGRWIVWLNLDVQPADSPESKDEANGWNWESVTDRLVLQDNSIRGFLAAVDPVHLSMATNEQLEVIMRYFKAEDDIESWKAIRRVQIQGYDNSGNVNRFYLNGVPMWLDKATRVGLVNSLTIEKAAGRTTSELWNEGNRIELDIDTALNLLSALELYAKDCYGTTASHLAAIAAAETIEELKMYEISDGYPGIPLFNANS